MGICGISGEDQNNLLQIAAGILHLGNIRFAEQGNNSLVADPNGIIDFFLFFSFSNI